MKEDGNWFVKFKFHFQKTAFSTERPGLHSHSSDF
jgi:hypothetical protein